MIETPAVHHQGDAKEGDMTVYFANAGLIDLEVIRTMGVSVKTNNNPIGYFGTGLKFAIATLLRTGHSLTMTRGGVAYEFCVVPTKIRGEVFSKVFMGGEPLPFTTELGKNWDVWQAYRELHSNTLDEAGVISDKPQVADTVFSVTGAAIQREYVNRDSIFLSSKPLDQNEFLEVHDGRTRTVYYRGVRAGVMPEEMAFTYNLLTPMTLTEDRTFESQFTVQWKLGALIPKLTHKGVIAEILTGDAPFEKSLSLTSCTSPSQQFMEVARSNYANMSGSAAARLIVDRDMQEKGEFKPAKMLDCDHERFLSAFGYLGNLGCSLSPEDVEIVESLGPSHMAIYHKGRNQIFVAKSTLDYGVETVVATLYEEWLHKEYSYEDESRELQTFLFQRLAALSMGVSGPKPKAQLGMPF